MTQPLQSRMPDPPVLIGVVNWNGADDTIECVDSLLNITYSNFTIILIDNGSTDGSFELLCCRFPELTVLSTGQNDGYAAACNLVIEQAITQGYEFVLPMNNDVTASPDFLTHLIMLMQTHPNCGLAGPKILNYYNPSVIDICGGTLHPHGHILDMTPDMLKNLEQGKALPLSFVSGCSPLIRVGLLKKYGGFNTTFFMYCEDVELCMRLSENGYDLFVVGQSKIYHKVSRSSKKMADHIVYYLTRNRFRMIIMHRHFFDNLVFFLYSIYWISKQVLTRQSNVHLKFRSVCDAWLNRMGKLV